MKKILMFMFTAALLAGCQQEENETTTIDTNSRITIVPVITRATEVDFENTDQIGVTITQSNDFVYASNKLMTYSDGVFSSDLFWYPEGNDKSQITAYYPYDAAGTPTSFTVKADQTTGYGMSDLIAASKSDVLPSTNAIVMNFKHILTKLVINIENDTQSNISSVVLKGSVPTATLDLPALSVTADENATATDITAQVVKANETYRAIVIPQTVAFTLEVTTADGKTLSQKLTSTTLAQGGQYSVNARVLPDNIIVTLSGKIESWTDQGEIGADNEISFEEHLDENYFLYDGERYETVTLSNGTTWMKQNMRYIPKGLTPSSDPLVEAHVWYPYELNYAQAETDNKLTTNLDASYVVPLTDKASIEKYGYLYDMSAIFGMEVTPDNYKKLENAQGICPKGWHVPNRAEYFDLIGASSANSLAGESGNKTYDQALFWGTDAKGMKYGTISNAIAQWGFEFSGMRFYVATPTATSTSRYLSTVVWTGNATKTDWYGNKAMTYIATSTPNALSNSNMPQLFTVMSTFTSTNYPEGRLSMANASSPYVGQGLRCVKNHDIDFYAKFEGTLIKPKAE